MDPLIAEKKKTDANSNVEEETEEESEIDASVINLNSDDHPEDCNCGISDVQIQEMIDELPFFDDE